MKANVPELLASAQKRLPSQPSKPTFQGGPKWVELGDADDFDPRDTLRCQALRAMFYRKQQKPTEN